MIYKLVGTFYICPTPIGNLNDISERILETLKSVDFIYCEDTRRAAKLTNSFSIDTPLKSFFLGNEFKKIKIDGLAAVVGDFVILDSDIDKTIIDLESQGVNTKDLDRCSLLGKLMEDKLYAHHAEQDSLEVDSQQIYNYVDQTIDYFVEQIGDIDKVLEFYKKEDEQSFRQELFEINKVNQLSQKMQTQIIDEIEITPEEVKQFFNSIPKYELPVFGAELEISQIIVKPEVGNDEQRKVIEKNMHRCKVPTINPNNYHCKSTFLVVFF